MRAVSITPLNAVELKRTAFGHKRTPAGTDLRLDHNLGRWLVTYLNDAYCPSQVVELGNHAKYGAGGVGQNDERRDSRLGGSAFGSRSDGGHRRGDVHKQAFS